MSTLRVNNVNEVGGDSVITAGILDSGSLPSGSILQVVSADDATDDIVSSTSFADTSLSATITPSSTSSKIMIFTTFDFQMSPNNTNPVAAFDIYSSNTSARILPQERKIYLNANTSIKVPASVSYLDSPATTSAVTYTLQIQATNQLTNCRTTGNKNMILMEVAA